MRKIDGEIDTGYRHGCCRYGYCRVQKDSSKHHSNGSIAVALSGDSLASPLTSTATTTTAATTATTTAAARAANTAALRSRALALVLQRLRERSMNASNSNGAKAAVAGEAWDALVGEVSLLQ